ncbi:MAG TPA: ATP-binding protein [Pyrinomonadaceae bacterium]|jgi:nitrogen fixation/metabolism regulation signal transduction histidine kinase|nr:ATP-binding protein [Pyrinomonadaceae bacterium]
MSFDPENVSPEFEQRRRRRRRLLLWALGITVALLLSIIVSQQLWLWTVVTPDTPSDAILLYALSTLNFVGFVVFSFIFVRNILKLRRERAERQLGSKLRTRLLVYFISISFLPITAMAVFSYLFLNRSLEKWFYPEVILQQASSVRRQTVDIQARNLQDISLLLVTLLGQKSAIEQQAAIDHLVSSGELAGVEIVSRDGTIQLKRRANLSSSEVQRLDELFAEARKASAPTGNTFADGKDFDVVAVPLNDSQTLIVAPPKRADNDLDQMMSASEQGYRDLVRKQRRIRMLGLSTLGLMTLILFFVSSWVAIYLARGIATPIKALAEASKEIARGHLSHRVHTVADDELAMLAESFNQMTSELEENRKSIEAGAEELREKNLALLERRNYIETVLQSLSTGVVSIDDADRITTLNASAARMLGLENRPDSGRLLSEVIGAEDWSVISRLLRRARRAGHAAEQTQLESGGNGAGPLPVAMTAAALTNSVFSGRGAVLVIEDLSELLAAQRVAAWSEVARRMAHEIKNPLTPIQLSAERIAKNYKRVASGNGQNGNHPQEESVEVDKVGAVIAECTETITREVAGLKAMVDEFSRFARLPAIQLESANLNEVITQAIGLYEERLDDATISVHLSPELPAAMLDVEQIKRVFVNLIDNALNALVRGENEKRITIVTYHDTERSLLVAEVADTGHGIAPNDFRRLFQPYFSRRDSGTGLGLAIVQRIIVEHHGRIRAEKNHPAGARFIIELPVSS